MERTDQSEHEEAGERMDERPEMNPQMAMEGKNKRNCAQCEARDVSMIEAHGKMRGAAAALRQNRSMIRCQQ